MRGPFATRSPITLIFPNRSTHLRRKGITLQIHRRDKHKRTWVDGILPGTNLNQELVRKGWIAIPEICSIRHGAARARKQHLELVPPTFPIQCAGISSGSTGTACHVKFSETQQARIRALCEANG
jgi:hypothetical protein